MKPRKLPGAPGERRGGRERGGGSLVAPETLDQPRTLHALLSATETRRAGPLQPPKEDAQEEAAPRATAGGSVGPVETDGFTRGRFPAQDLVGPRQSPACPRRLLRTRAAPCPVRGASYRRVSPPRPANSRRRGSLNAHRGNTPTPSLPAFAHTRGGRTDPPWLPPPCSSERSARMTETCCDPPANVRPDAAENGAERHLTTRTTQTPPRDRERPTKRVPAETERTMHSIWPPRPQRTEMLCTTG